MNAVYKPATDSINTIGTAFDLSDAFSSLGTTPSADRAGVVGTLGATPIDYYAIPLTAGQTTTIAVKGTSGTASIELFDASGNLLALARRARALIAIISDFVAQTAGTYYVDVTGATGAGLRPGRGPGRQLRHPRQFVCQSPAAQRSGRRSWVHSPKHRVSVPAR